LRRGGGEIHVCERPLSMDIAQWIARAEEQTELLSSTQAEERRLLEQVACAKRRREQARVGALRAASAALAVEAGALESANALECASQRLDRLHVVFPFSMPLSAASASSSSSSSSFSSSSSSYPAAGAGGLSAATAVEMSRLEDEAQGFSAALQAEKLQLSSLTHNTRAGKQQLLEIKERLQQLEGRSAATRAAKEEAERELERVTSQTSAIKAELINMGQTALSDKELDDFFKA
jgi:hypothetical protein